MDHPLDFGGKAAILLLAPTPPRATPPLKPRRLYHTCMVKTHRPQQPGRLHPTTRNTGARRDVVRTPTGCIYDVRILEILSFGFGRLGDLTSRTS